MKAVITGLKESESCSWCQRPNKETVIATFEGGIFKESLLCFKCFQQAYRNQWKQKADAETEKASPA